MQAFISIAYTQIKRPGLLRFQIDIPLANAGIVIQIGVQAFLNIAVASNAFFNTGVSLPFLSYGGTALMMQLAEMGVVLNISRKATI